MTIPPIPGSNFLSPVSSPIFTLPTGIEPPSVTEATTVLLYGRTKLGKTEAVCQLPNSLIVMLEEGAERFPSQRHDARKYSFNKLTDFCLFLAKENRYEYVVFDTIDRVEDLCSVEATERYKQTAAGKNFKGFDVCTELDFGNGFSLLRQRLKEVLTVMFLSAPKVILLGHVRDKYIKDTEAARMGSDFSAKELDLTGKCSDIVTSRCSVNGHLTRRPRVKKHPADPTISDIWISCKTSEDSNAGSSFPYIAGKEFLISSADDHKFKWELIFPSLATKI